MSQMKSFNDITSQDPFQQYYNIESLKDVVLTCDSDWAPDHAIETVATEIKKRGLRMSFYATHFSPLLAELSQDSSFEVGLHPDFTRQRGPFSESLSKLKDFFPASRGMRAHRNLFGQNISDLAKACGLEYDVSTLMWSHSHLQTYRDYNGLYRIPYCWEDGIHLDVGYSEAALHKMVENPGLKVLNCHPILLALNSPTEDHRRAFTKKFSDLTSASRQEIAESRFDGEGIFDLWKRLLDRVALSAVSSHRVCDLLPKT